MRLPFRGATAAAPAAPPRASVDAGSVAQHFNFEWAVNQDDHPELDTYWWWVVSVRLDPNEVWMEADDGTLWVIPFTTDGVDVTSVGEPAESRLVAVPATAADGATASAAVDRRRQRVLAAFHDRPEKPAPTTAAEVRPDSEEETTMARTFMAALRSRLGISAAELPDDATDDQINAALATEDLPSEEEQPNEPGTTDEGAPGAEDEHPPGEVPEPDPPPASASERVATVDRDRLDQLERDAAAGAAARRAQLASELDAEVDAAVTDGRITPASRDGWRASIDPGDSPDAAATARATAERQALAALTPGRVPVHQRGTATTSTSNDPGYDRVRASMGLKARKES